jgi:hypothetical protein
MVVLVILGLVAFIWIAKPSKAEQPKKDQAPTRTYETNYSDFSNIESEGSN